MDPLFGFIDDISVQPSEENNGAVGEYTISYPTDLSQQQYQLHHSNAQFSNNALDSSAQVVHVVSENSQNEKQIYVIKLENFLKDDGNPDVATIKFEGPEPTADENEIKMEVDPSDLPNIPKDPLLSTSDSSSSEEDDDKESNQEHGNEAGPDPNIAISPEAVMAMAHSVGVDLNEDHASELGCIAINKLRHAILIAMQFSQNENSEGITVEHFAKAEVQLGSPGIGQESIFRETAYKYVGGVCVIDDGPEIDLYASVHQQNISQLSADDNDAILNVHHIRTHGPIDRNASTASDFQHYDDMIAECCDEKQSENTEENSNIPDAPSEDTNVNLTNSAEDDDPLSNNTHAVDSEFSSSNFPNADEDESSDDDACATVSEFLKENPTIIDNKTIENQKKNNCESETESRINLAPEWVVYLQMLIEEIVGHNYKQDTNCSVSSHFNMILKDVQQHGVTPIFHILCDAFRDYLREPKISRDSIMNIISIVDALVSSNAEPTSEQMTDLGSVLIEIIILPSPCEINHYLTHVFMKIMKNCNQLLTWTCTYVTEMLKEISEMPFEEVSSPFKSTILVALCLANGLEDLKIQVAQEFGWHSSVISFSRNHCSVFDGEAPSPTSQDASLEEEILKFYYNFMKNYTSLVPSSELSGIRDVITALYGERFSSFVPPPSSPPSLSINKNSKTKLNKKTRCVFRKITYKDKEIMVPYRKIVE